MLDCFGEMKATKHIIQCDKKREFLSLTWAKGVTMKSSAVCLMTENQKMRTEFLEQVCANNMCGLTLRWRGKNYERLSLVTCHSLSQIGTGRTLFSDPEWRRCARWGLDFGNPEGCDLRTRHFLLHSWKKWRTTLKSLVWTKKKRSKHVWWSADLSASGCVMEMRGGIRRGRVVGRDVLLRTSGERVRSRGRSQQGTWRDKIHNIKTNWSFFTSL